MLRRATMPDGSRYAGRFNLEGLREEAEEWYKEHWGKGVEDKDGD